MNGDKTYLGEQDHTEDTIYRRRFSRYLYMVIHGASIDFIEKHRRQQEHEVLVDEIPDTVMLHAEDMDNMLNEIVLLQAIRKLSLQQQMVIVEYFIHQFSITEIAARHSMSFQNVSRIKQRALDELRKVYEANQLNEE